MVENSLDCVEGSGWILTTEKIQEECANCGKKLEEQKLYCKQTKELYCPKCSIKVSTNHARLERREDHEHFNIIDIKCKK